MIWIVDNGGEYSDHAYYILDTPDDFPMVEWIDGFRPGFHVVCAAPEVCWYAGNPMSLKEFKLLNCYSPPIPEPWNA